MAVSYDLPDNNSPYGTIHPRDKTTVAERLIPGARSIAYDDPVYWTGPIVEKAILKEIIITITFTEASLRGKSLEMRSKAGFEVGNFHRDLHKKL